MSSVTSELGYKPIGQLLIKYSIPAIIGMLSTALYNAIDRVFIGQAVGPHAIAGLSLVFPIMTILQAFGTLVGAGSAARISIALGKKDTNLAEKIMGNALVLTFIFWTLLCVLGFIFTDQVLIAFGASENTLPYAKQYFLIILFVYLFNNFSTSFSSMMRASGFPRKSMISVLIGVTVNIALDALFILQFDMGVKGAALATLIAVMASSVYVSSHFESRLTSIRIRRKNIKLEWPIIKQIVSIGFSPFVMSLVGASVVVLLNRLLFKYGGDFAIGAYGIVSSYAGFFVMITNGLCQGMQPIIGYNYGAGKLARMKKTLIMCIAVAVCINLIIFVMASSIPEKMASLFTSSQEMIDIAKDGIIFTFLIFPLVGFQIVVSSFFQYIGKAHLSVFMSLCKQVLFLLPGLYIFSYFFELRGIWYAYPVADIFSVILAAIVLYSQRKVFSHKTATL